MAYKYGDRRTAFNGVFKHVFNVYPKAKEILGFYEGIPKDQQHCRWNSNGFKEFLKSYRLSKSSNPSNDIRKNCEYIQKDFQSFITYCNTHLK
ncbi:hypothetical protein [Sphingobacterium sp. UBA6320]|uniref:hypothetical protein n=1 Tax=Sphingobacterium sp. UBA6320 TaxID=1947510 RepID=UPI0025CCDD91|nr:hypothetical protein [Sphingobacterium sp. UBA6320]